METGLIIIEEYCKNSRIESSFVSLLINEGLIDVQVADGQMYLYESQLAELDRFANLYYDLSVNVEGIDIIHNLLKKMENMEKELYILRKRLHVHDNLWEGID
ncbi:chaperone modulator CbpM [Dysgonomonas capnocytophagoides]|uniref:chaperone modulator CbpM n=1 Tax=Dysgonomonas capnocytophagoides TaxID=45254 RepID=UPI00291FCEBE|nr:chaperone modulator CbpM [Dysgonomonas capnocytophagoides]